MTSSKRLSSNAGSYTCLCYVSARAAWLFALACKMLLEVNKLDDCEASMIEISDLGLHQRCFSNPELSSGYEQHHHLQPQRAVMVPTNLKHNFLTYKYPYQLFQTSYAKAICTLTSSKTLTCNSKAHHSNLQFHPGVHLAHEIHHPRADSGSTKQALPVVSISERYNRERTS